MIGNLHSMCNSKQLRTITSIVQNGDHENFKRKQAELKEKYLFEMKKEGEDK